MLGFSGIIGTSTSPSISENSITGEDYCFQYKSNDKFIADKFFLENEDYIWGLDGYVLNRKNLQNNFANSEWSKLFLHEFLKNADNILSLMSGEFAGFVYTKKDKSLQLFNNSTGSKNYHFFQNEDCFIFSSGPILVHQYLKALNIPISFDELSISMFLSYGYYINYGSVFKEISKMKPGTILEIKGSKLSSSHYKSFANLKKFELGETELLKAFDQEMLEAVRVNFEKDRSEGYEHYVTLSGGMDSRVTSMIGHQLGYTEQLNICCSKSNYDDHITSQKIASDLGHKYFFYPLDKPEHLLSPEEQIRENDGLVNYSGAAHVHNTFKVSYNPKHGLIQTGQLGDGILGGFLSTTDQAKPDFRTGMMTDIFYKKYPEQFEAITDGFEDEESFKLYTRGFLLNHNSFWLMESMGYYSSPFLNEQFLEFSMRIPNKFKYREIFYLKWMQKHQANLVKYPWEYIHMKPDAMWKINYARWINYVRYFHKKYSLSARRKNQMTPEEHWLNSPTGLTEFLSKRFQELFELLPDAFPLKTEIKAYFESGNFNQKTTVISLLQSISEFQK